MAIKDQPYYRDEGANIVVFVSLKHPKGPVVSVKTANSEFTVEQQKVVSTLELLSSLPPKITNETEIAPIRDDLAKMKAFAARFPQSQALLKGRIENFENISGAYTTGKVLVDKKWIPKSEYDASVAASIDKPPPATPSDSQIKGEKFPVLTTNSGKEYRKVTVRNVTPFDISVLHESGITKVQLADLSQDLQKHFGYDPAKADVYQKQQVAYQKQQEKAEASREAADVATSDTIFDSEHYQGFENRWFEQHDADLINIFPSLNDAAARRRMFQTLTHNSSGALHCTIEALAEPHNARIYKENGYLDEAASAKAWGVQCRRIVDDAIKEAEKAKGEYSDQTRQCYALISTLIQTGLTPLIDPVADEKRREARWTTVAIPPADFKISTGVFTITQVLRGACLGYFLKPASNGADIVYMDGLADDGLRDDVQLIVECVPQGTIQYQNLLGQTNTVAKYRITRWRPQH